jgi:hypothetical protein
VMAMRGVHLLKRAGREFLRNLIWMAVAFGLLAAVLIFGAGLPLLGALPFVGIFVSVIAAITTLLTLWGGAHDGTLLRSNRGTWGESGHYYSGGTYYPGFLDGGGFGGGGCDGGGGGGDCGGLYKRRFRMSDSQVLARQERPGKSAVGRLSSASIRRRRCSLDRSARLDRPR